MTTISPHLNLPAPVPQVPAQPTLRQPTLPPWKVFFSIVRFRPWFCFVDFISILIIRAMTQLAPGLIIQAFFNLLTGKASTGFNLGTVVALLFATYIGHVIGEYGFVYADVPISADVNTWLRRNILKYILKRPGATSLPDSPGEAVSRLVGDVRELSSFIFWANDTFSGILVILISIGILISISPWITLLAFVPLIIVGFTANAATSRYENYRRASRQASGKVTGFIGEFFGAVQAVKVATAEENVIQHFTEVNEERRKLTLRERLFNEILNSLYQNTSSLSTGIILLLSGQAMRAGTFTVGDFSLFVYLLQSMGQLTTFAGQIVAHYRQFSVSIERIYRLMEGAPQGALIEPCVVKLDSPLPVVKYPDRVPADRLDLLEIRDLSFHYPGSRNGIQKINFSIRRGTLTVITGEVGSGKTTLLRVLLGLLTKESGEIRWNGDLIENYGEFFIPPRCAYTGQVPRLFSISLRDNLLLGLNKSDEEIIKCLRLAVMEDDLKEMDKGLDTLVGPRGVRLSGGQAQRSAAARMILREAELMVFDDLSSALDVETEHTLWERIFERAGQTCLVVSHRRPVLRRANQIILMANGYISDQGSLNELLARSEEMCQIWQHSSLRNHTE
jgi:ATP-binding cassette, subfamily B, bacterial